MHSDDDELGDPKHVRYLLTATDRMILEQCARLIGRTLTREEEDESLQKIRSAPGLTTEQLIVECMEFCRTIYPTPVPLGTLLTFAFIFTEVSPRPRNQDELLASLKEMVRKKILKESIINDVPYYALSLGDKK